MDIIATEDNVVGELFLQNGEDNGYDPEDFVMDMDVGASMPRFCISVADDDGGIPGSLFACAVWNGAVRSCCTRNSQRFCSCNVTTIVWCSEIDCHAFCQVPGAG